jgi:hypothetical protein
MKKTIVTLSFFFSLYLVFNACKKTTEVESGKPNSTYISAMDCTGSTPTYIKDVKTLFDTKCATSGCHGATNPAHGLNLTTYELSKRDFNVHAFLCSINQDAGCSKMPQGSSKMSADEIKKITCWAKNSFPQ